MTSPFDQAFRLLGRAMRQWRLIEDGDSVLIGLSGGKDSLFLCELLSRRQRIFVPQFRLAAVHVRMQGVDYDADTSYLQRFCDQLDMPLYIKEAGGEPDRKARRSPCFLCSWTRRKVMFDLAQAEGFNKLALGHHQDDLLLTLLMNLTFNGRCESMEPLLRLDKMPLALIRPMCLIPEALITQHSTGRYQPLHKTCPHDTEGNRHQIRALLDHMLQLNPEARQSLWHAACK